MTELEELRLAYAECSRQRNELLNKLKSHAQRSPLTVTEVEQILAQHNYEIHGDRARYIVRMTEAAHNIKGNT